MLFPTSLSADILRRSFRAPNGELGILESDVQAFLTACEVEGIKIFGWELWIVDHVPSPCSDEPLPDSGAIWSLIPPWALLQGNSPICFGGVGDLPQTSRECAHLKLECEIKPQWLEHVRFNFALSA